MKSNLIQLLIAALLALAGIALLFVGTMLAPQGEIHDSILVAFGEIATFAGSIIGIDYHYKQRNYDTKPHQNKPEGKSRKRDNIAPLRTGNPELSDA